LSLFGVEFSRTGSYVVPVLTTLGRESAKGTGG
jgi:hypothetical protein